MIYVLDTNAVSALAAHALVLDATLVTANVDHTIRVPRLLVEDWS